MEPVGGGIADELARFDAVPGLAPIVAAWPAAVGTEIAKNAWPARLMRDGTLIVHASSATWAFELGHLEARIRSALGDAAPRKLRFVVGPLPEPATEDENLRKVVAKAAALSLARGSADRSLW